MLPKQINLRKKNYVGRLVLTLAKLSKKKTLQEGLTLIESLVAIAVIAVVITSFTPAIFISVATRIQNRRAEQALQLAQGEIDRVRRTVEQGIYDNIKDLPPKGSAPDNQAEQQGPPNQDTSTLPSGYSFTNNASTGLLVDINGDQTPDFVVQTYRTTGVQDLQGKVVAFSIGVRVYSAVVRQNFNDLEQPPIRAASLQFSTALGQQRRRPLAVMYTNIVRSDTQTSLCSYQQFLNPGATLPSGCQ